MTDPTETEPALEDIPADQWGSERIDVEGVPQPGNTVEVEYVSNAGGSYRPDGNSTVRGELIYAEPVYRMRDDRRFRFVINDQDAPRGVVFYLDPDTPGKKKIRSLKARKTKRGMTIGDVVGVTFLDDGPAELAPIANAIRTVQAGDTMNVNGEEFGVVNTFTRGPDRVPEGHTAILTRPDGTEFTLSAHPRYNRVRFRERDHAHSHGEEIPVESVSPARFCDRIREDWDGEDTTDRFPSPHGFREGERVEITLDPGDDPEDGGPDQPVTARGTVESVRYFTAEVYHTFTGFDEKDPETRIRLDDGAEVVVSDRSRHAFGTATVEKAMFIPADADGADDYWHSEDPDIQALSESDGDAEADGGRLMADGGDGVDIDRLSDVVEDATVEGSPVRYALADHPDGVEVIARGDGAGGVRIAATLASLLDREGFQWYQKPDARYVSGVNRARIIVTGSRSVADVLKGSRRGDTLRLLIKDGGIHRELVAGVMDSDYAPAETVDGIPVSGEVIVDLEIRTDAGELLPEGRGSSVYQDIIVDPEDGTPKALPTVSVSIRADEKRPGEWEAATASVWNPEYEIMTRTNPTTGEEEEVKHITDDDWTGIGEVVMATVIPDSEDSDSDGEGPEVRTDGGTCSDDGYRHTHGLFVSPRPGNTTHIYDEDKEAEGFKSDQFRTSLCGQSWAKVNQGKSFISNRSEVDCGNCLRYVEDREGRDIRTDGGRRVESGDPPSKNEVDVEAAKRANRTGRCLKHVSGTAERTITRRDGTEETLTESFSGECGGRLEREGDQLVCPNCGEEYPYWSALFDDDDVDRGEGPVTDGGEDMISCPNCTNGTITESWLTGDGQPGVPVEIHSEDRTCDFCDGEGVIPEDSLPDEPEPEADGGRLMTDGGVSLSELDVGDHIAVEYDSKHSHSDDRMTKEGEVTDVDRNPGGKLLYVYFRADEDHIYAVDHHSIWTTGESPRPFGSSVTVRRGSDSGDEDPEVRTDGGACSGGSEREVSVLVRRMKTLDTSRIEEWVLANFADGDEIQIQDVQTGEIYYDNIGSRSLSTDSDRDIRADGGRDVSPLRDDRRGALFSDDREYRYRLWRTWDVEKPAVAFIMLNPSTADETTLDPTCRRCKGFAERWGYGTLIVGNIFALRSTDPENLYDHPDPVGPENDDHLRSICEDADRVIAAWGHHGGLNDRGAEVTRELDASLRALDTTQVGHPVHPLYQPADADPEPYPDDDADLITDGGFPPVQGPDFPPDVGDQVTLVYHTFGEEPPGDRMNGEHLTGEVTDTSSNRYGDRMVEVQGSESDTRLCVRYGRNLNAVHSAPDGEVIGWAVSLSIDRMATEDVGDAMVTDGGRRLPERCPSCGRFCHVVYRWRGPSYMEVRSCPNAECDYPDRRRDAPEESGQDGIRTDGGIRSIDGEREIVDECDNCGQATYYRCIRFGRDRLCEGCYRDAAEAIRLRTDSGSDYPALTDPEDIRALDSEDVNREVQADLTDYIRRFAAGERETFHREVYPDIHVVVDWDILTPEQDPDASAHRNRIPGDTLRVTFQVTLPTRDLPENPVGPEDTAFGDGENFDDATHLSEWGDDYERAVETVDGVFVSEWDAGLKPAIHIPEYSPMTIIGADEGQRPVMFVASVTFPDYVTEWLTGPIQCDCGEWIRLEAGGTECSVCGAVYSPESLHGQRVITPDGVPIEVGRGERDPPSDREIRTDGSGVDLIADCPECGGEGAMRRTGRRRDGDQEASVLTCEECGHRGESVHNTYAGVTATSPSADLDGIENPRLEFIDEGGDDQDGEVAEVRTDGGVPDAYDIKTVRVHEPDKGRYIYVMINRFDGSDHILGEMGFGGVYYQFSVMSQEADFRLTRLSAYEIGRDHPVGWFTESNAYALIQGIDEDDGGVQWDAISDGDYLDAEDVAELIGGRDVRTDGGVDQEHVRERAGTRLVNQRHVDDYDVDVGRADRGRGTILTRDPGEPGWLGNPHTVNQVGRETAVNLYKSTFYKKLNRDPEFRHAVLDLRGKTLACWCVPELCHGDVILEFIDRYGSDSDGGGEDQRGDRDE